MTSITETLSASLGASFAAMGLPADLGQVAESDRPDLAPYQCNGAMAAAKLAKKAPRAVAEEVVAHFLLSQSGIEVEIAGPGFINLTPAAGLYSARANQIAAEAEQALKAVADNRGAQMADMHRLGHVRSAEVEHHHALALDSARAQPVVRGDLVGPGAVQSGGRRQVDEARPGDFDLDTGLA